MNKIPLAAGEKTLKVNDAYNTAVFRIFTYITEAKLYFIIF